MPEPDTSVSRPPPAVWALLALAALTAVLGVSVPLAPVHAEQPVVSWPATGDVARSTVLPLAPYRPLSLQATVGCATLRGLPDPGADPDGRADALRTVPFDARQAVQGLRVSADGGQLRVQVSGADLLTESVPAGDCRYQVVADGAGVRVLRDGVLLAERPDLLPPQVAELATDAAGAPAGELAVQLRPDDRYASAPTALKTGLLIAHVLALAALVALAVRLWPGRRPPNRPGLVVPRPSGADAVVVVVSAAWAVLGGVNWDDSWYLLMARNVGESGYLGNYVYMFNSTENPFVASQYLMAGWAAVGQALFGGGWELLWMRLLPLGYGLATWVLLRILLATALGRAGRLPRVAWLLMIAHLLWWLPYGMILRPEPLIALCSAGVLVLAELARRRRSLGALVAATAVAALALTVSPSGAVAWAPLVVTLPWLLPLLRQAGVVAAGTAVLAAGAAASVVIPVGFADASLGEVLDATVTHNWYYLTYSWYEEIVHYGALLELSDTGVWGRRAPVVLTLVVLVLAAIGSGRRRGPGDPLHRLLLGSTITTAVALALISVTPTKWVNHFGALGAIGTVVLTAALLRSPLPPRRSRVSGAGPAATGAAVLAVAAAAALVFAGPNLWRPFSDWGQPFGNHQLAGGTPYELSLMAPHFGGIYLRDPLVWVALAGLLAAGTAWWRRRGGRIELTADRGLLLVTSALSVGLLVAVFVLAPIRQYPGWTVALSNLQALTGRHCGLADTVQVLAPAGAQPVPEGVEQVSGDFAPAAGAPAPLRAPDGTGRVWHDAVPEREGVVWGPGTASERGTLTTPWYPLPPGSPATHVSVPVAAGETKGQQVRVQFGVAAGGIRVPVRTVPLELDPRADPDTWQEIPVPLDARQADTGHTDAGQPDTGQADPGPRADAVRLLVRDDRTGPDSWLAVAAPALTSWQPVGSVIGGRPVFADQLSAVLWPCVEQAAIGHGMVEPPAVRLLTDDGIPEFVLRNPLDPQWGGSFVQAGYTSTYVAMASRIHPSAPPARQWGHVQRVRYDHPAGLVDVRVHTGVEPGWHRDPPVTGDAYSGRKYRG